MLTLKHLAREHDVDPYALRMALRASQLEPQVNKRWKWESSEDPEYQKANSVAASLASRLKSKSINSSGSLEETPTTPSLQGNGRAKATTSRNTPSAS